MQQKLVGIYMYLELKEVFSNFNIILWHESEDI